MDTPCIKICLVNERAGLCVGCGRSLDEIAGWLALSPAQRQRIMAELPKRMANLSFSPAGSR